MRENTFHKLRFLINLKGCTNHNWVQIQVSALILSQQRQRENSGFYGEAH